MGYFFPMIVVNLLDCVPADMVKTTCLPFISKGYECGLAHQACKSVHTYKLKDLPAANQ